MNIPKNIKVGGFIYEIEENEKVAIEGNAYGSTHLMKEKIYLDPTSSVQRKEQVLLHEAMHAVWHNAGLHKRQYDNKQEEEIVDALSMGLYQVLKDNKLHFHE